MLKPALARGTLRCLGATTVDEYRKVRYLHWPPAQVTPRANARQRGRSHVLAVWPGSTSRKTRRWRAASKRFS